MTGARIVRKSSKTRSGPDRVDRDHRRAICTRFTAVTRCRPIAQARKEGRANGSTSTASPKAGKVRLLKAERVSHSEIARHLAIVRTSVRRTLAAGWRPVGCSRFGLR